MREQRRWPLLAIAAIALALIGAVVVDQRGHRAPQPAAEAPAPAGPPPEISTVPTEGVLVGAANAPVTIDLFTDPICPGCGEFITEYAPEIGRAVDDKRIAVRFHLLNILDDASASGDYSSRVIAAGYCVAAGDPGRFLAFYTAISAPDFQPDPDGVVDHTDDELADVAGGLGLSDQVTGCIRGRALRVAVVPLAMTALDRLERLGEVAVPSAYNGSRRLTLEPGWLDGL